MATVADVTVPPDKTTSTVRPLPDPPVVGRPVLFWYPDPPVIEVLSNVLTVSLSLAAVTVMVAVLVGAVPPNCVPKIVIVSLVLYLDPGVTTVVVYVAPDRLTSKSAFVPVPVVEFCSKLL